MNHTAIAAAALFAAGTAVAAPVSPVAIGTVQVTGTVTADTGQFFGGLLRDFNNNNRNRVSAEYAVADFGGSVIDMASFDGEIAHRQSPISPVITYELLVYEADGQLTAADFEPTGTTSIGTFQAPSVGTTPIDPNGPDTAFDVTSVVQGLVDGGAEFIGFQVRVTDGRSLSELENAVFDVEASGGGGGCPADFNGDGAGDVFDLIDFLVAFSAGDSSADFDGVAGVDVFDLIEFLIAFSAGCP